MLPALTVSFFTVACDVLHLKRIRQVLEQAQAQEMWAFLKAG
jgi:hypothetical protein